MSPESTGFASPAEALRLLGTVGYLADEEIATVVYLASRLEKPILVEGPAGTGKTELAKSVALALELRLLRLQCYEGLDEAKVLYEWNYRKQLLRIQVERSAKGEESPAWSEVEEDIFSEEFLLARPVLQAISSPDPVVLLVDEIDRVELETEALLLEVLSDYQISIPELGTVHATGVPLVFLTSNGTRELSEALKRRCLFLYLDYPSLERERAIVLERVPGIVEHLADEVVHVVALLRGLELEKHPSISETLDWARTLVLLGAEHADPATTRSTLNLLLKYRSDIETAARELALSGGGQPAGTVIDVLSRFISELRDSGVPVSTREAIDAAVAVGEVPLLDREAMRSALGATLIKSAEHRLAFNTAFDIFFSRRGAPPVVEEVLTTGGTAPTAGPSTAAAGQGALGAPLPTAAELAEMLREAILSGEADQLRQAARLSVALFGGVEASRPVGVSYYLHKTLRGVGLEDLLAQLLRGALEGGSGEGGGLSLPGSGALRDRFAADELGRRGAAFRSLLEEEIRRLLVEGRGAGAVAKSVRRPLLEDVDFMHASRDELAAMRRAIYPLARILAARLARRRRRGRRGPLDFRATIRRSLSQGGVPLEPRFRPPHPARPELFVLADVSGSVASFARFTVLLVYAIAAEFSKVRSAVFIDGVDEVTGLLRRSASIADAIERLAREADVVQGDGHSDYGSAFRLFHERHARQLSAKTDLLILGDARNNYHASEAAVLKDLQRRAHRVLWLNPEPRAYWGSGDSIIGEYAPFCDGVFECRNLRQLQAFVDELA